MASSSARASSGPGRAAVPVRRVVDKLLHTPTVQIKRLAEGPDGSSYAAALRELFELDPQTPAVLAATESGTRTASVEPGDEVDQALAGDTRGPGGRR